MSQDSDSLLSRSELHYDNIIQSNIDDVGASRSLFDRLEVATPSKVAHDLQFQETQSLVNQQILSQLTTISDRLDKLEKKPTKKTNDILKIKGSCAGKEPKSTRVNKTKSVEVEKNTPASTTECCSQSGANQNNQIQRSVEERINELQQLAKSGMPENKIQSQRGGQVDVFVKNRVKWPHEYVWGGGSQKRFFFDQLTMGQWMAGFCRTMTEKNCIQNKDAMLDYLISLLDDSNDFCGLLQKPAMQCSYVAWSKTKF